MNYKKVTNAIAANNPSRRAKLVKKSVRHQVKIQGRRAERAWKTWEKASGQSRFKPSV